MVGAEWYRYTLPVDRPRITGLFSVSNGHDQVTVLSAFAYIVHFLDHYYLCTRLSSDARDGGRTRRPKKFEIRLRFVIKIRFDDVFLLENLTENRYQIKVESKKITKSH